MTDMTSLEALAARVAAIEARLADVGIPPKPVWLDGNAQDGGTVFLPAGDHCVCINGAWWRHVETGVAIKCGPRAVAGVTYLDVPQGRQQDA